MAILSVPAAIPIPTTTPASTSALGAVLPSSGKDLAAPSGRPNLAGSKKSTSFANDLQRALGYPLPVTQVLHTAQPTKLPDSRVSKTDSTPTPNHATLALLPTESGQPLAQLPASPATPAPGGDSAPSSSVPSLVSFTGPVQQLTIPEPVLAGPVLVSKGEPLAHLANKDVSAPKTASAQVSFLVDPPKVTPSSTIPGGSNQQPRIGIPPQDERTPASITVAAPLVRSQPAGSQGTGVLSQAVPQATAERFTAEPQAAPGDRSAPSQSVPTAQLPPLLPSTRPAPVLVPVVDGNLVGANFADLGRKMEGKDRSELNESIGLKETSTGGGRDAVINHMPATERPAPAVVEGAAEDAPVADQVAGSILTRSELVMRQGHAEFHLRLEPPELGTIRVHLRATDSGISARLFVHDPAARQLIQSQLESLRQKLKEDGVAVGGFDVASNDAGAGGQRQDRSESSGEQLRQIAQSGQTRPARKAALVSAYAVDVVV